MQVNFFVELPITKEFITFSETDLLGAKIASGLLGKGFSKFILACGKTLFHYIAVIGAWNAGLPFCPIDIEGPVERTLSILNILSEFAILCSHETIEHIPKQHQNRCILVEDTLSSSPYEGNLVNPDICYLIATSGTTGTPKLISVSRNPVKKFIEWAIPYYGMNNETRWAQFSPVTFDLSLVDIYSCYFSKATLIPVIAQNEKIMPYRFIINNNITHWHSVPSAIRFITGDHSAKIVNRPILFSFCGEPLLKEWVNRLKSIFPDSKVINTYGPTEATFFCSYFDTDDIPAGQKFASYPIGKPIPGWNFIFQANTEDDDYELLIVSDYISNGYINIESHDFGKMHLNNNTTLVFRTRDVFHIENGYIFFQKRTDNQIKLFGNRIDLGEIENACLNVGIKNPVAVVDANHVVLFSEGATVTLDYNILYSMLKNQLPSYAIPSRCISLEFFPYTSSGKIDKEKLKGMLRNGL